MGLDIYVGSLTRYYSGNWQTIVQQSAAEQGLDIRMDRPPPPNALRDSTAARAAVVQWRDAMSQGLGKHIEGALDWDESDGAPYFTDKPAWDCYGDLVLWAAYEEQPNLKRPAAAVEDWTKDPAFLASTSEKFHSRYSQLLHNTELWLPCPFPFTFVAKDVGGNQVGIGSSVALGEQLRSLNQRTWRADPSLLERWRKEGADFGAPLETGARFAFSLMLALTDLAVQHGLPMKLDY